MICVDLSFFSFLFDFPAQHPKAEVSERLEGASESWATICRFIILLYCKQYIRFYIIILIYVVYAVYNYILIFLITTLRSDRHTFGRRARFLCTVIRDQNQRRRVFSLTHLQLHFCSTLLTFYGEPYARFNRVPLVLVLCMDVVCTVYPMYWMYSMAYKRYLIYISNVKVAHRVAVTLKGTKKNTEKNTKRK